MKLSIVTSFFNSENYIDELSKSIFSQTYTNWEWIIADDFSTDLTKEKLLELSKKDERIKLIELKYKKELWWNPQLYATGDIVCPIDGDDKILPNTFEKIKYYFEKFPDIIFLHFNANKYEITLPQNKDEYLEKFVDNVYISKDNNSFLEGFERLSPHRTGIFGYLRIFRNVPDLFFKVHTDTEVCSSNDGQWLLKLEELGNWLTIPRTTYIARNHYGSENFRNWNLQGEVRLIKEAKERRKKLNLKYPRKNDYFDDIYELAESTYLSQINWEDKKCKIAFFNFGYNESQIEKSKILFFDHDLCFDNNKENCDYSFVRINSFDKEQNILKYLDIINNDSKLVFYCDNVHLQYANRTNVNKIDVLKKELETKALIHFVYQNNRVYFTVIKRYTDQKIESFAEVLNNSYSIIPKVNRIKKEKNVEVSFNYFKNPKITVQCPENKVLDIDFIDETNNNSLYKYKLSNNMFSQLNIEYHKNFRVEICDEGKLIKTIKPSFENQRVYIHLDSSSLGDTLAWIPYVDEFRKKHNCKVICSTFLNDFFVKTYKDIEFVKPGTVVENLYKIFSIGWFYNDKSEIETNRNPFNFRDQNLQKTATDILGLEFTEIRPKVFYELNKKNIHKKYFCIATHSTAQSKYWNNPSGWQEVVNYLKEKGYEVVLLSKEENGYMGNKDPDGVIKLQNKSMNDIINYIYHSEGFIGLGSGLSWLSWALNKTTVLISAFSRPICEMTDCHRIFVPDPINTCNGCFNDYRLDAGDWNWCPRHKGTDRQFECSKSITGNQVISQLKKILGDSVDS